MKTKILKIIILSCAGLCILGAVIYGLVTGTLCRGNLPQYLPQRTQSDMNSNLRGKKILFLGSSVTYGYASLGNSFADYLEAKDGVISYKEAVCGTTLADINEKSYVSRLKAVDTALSVDAFVCQLSTNDATKGIPLGEVSASFEADDFDTSTVTGAMEYIIAYAESTFGCPVVFYTGTKYDSEEYGEMVNALLMLREKWNITVIDLWNSEKMNSVTDEQYSLYMADSIHPSMAGYRDWWLPEFEQALSALFGK